MWTRGSQFGIDPDDAGDPMDMADCIADRNGLLQYGEMFGTHGA